MPRKSVQKPVEIDRSFALYKVGAVILLGVCITGGTIWWAQHDTGSIDVTALIVNSREYQEGMSDGVSDEGSVQTPPSDTYANMPNGGLQAQGGEVVAPPIPEPIQTEATSTGTTTDATTESTATGSEEDTQSDTAANSDGESPDTPAQTDTTEAPGGDGSSESAG